MPGQFGPMSRTFLSRRPTLARIMSMTGMPSVMQTMSSMPASAASRIASAAPGAGTKIMVALQPVFSRASCEVLKTGTLLSQVSPPRPGRDAGDDVGAVFGALLGVESARFSGDALDEQARVFIDEDGHDEELRKN